MYDNDGNGSPQAPVRPEFNMAEATRMLDDYKGGHSNFPVAQGIVDSFVSEYQENHGDRMYSDRKKASGYDYSKTFLQQLLDFDSNLFPERDTFVLGGTPDVLRRIELANLPMTINQRHVSDSLYGTYKGTQQEKQDHTFTLQELSTLPEKIADPIAIIHDKRAGKAASQSNVDVLVEMTAASGKQVIAAVQIGGNGHINGLRIDANKVATVHGNKDSIARLIDAINANEAGEVAVFL